MRKFLPWLCASAFLFSGLQVLAQNDRQAILDQIAGKLARSLQSNKEMIYLHIDKPYHLAGTTLFFRAYLLNQQSLLPSSLSSIIYIDLLNEEMKPIDQAMLYARDLELGGGIKLPAKLNEGNYYLRGFTNLMSPDAPESFIVPVYIINPDQGAANTKSVRKWRAANSEMNGVRFFPEGGSLINGVDCIVAVKATDATGKPAAMSGIIKDNRDSIVANFQTAVNGLGKFIFNPYKNRKYRAILKNGASQETSIDLPALSNNAYQLALIKQDSQKISFRVALSDPLYEKKAGSYLVGVSRGRVAFASIGAGMYKVDIPVSNFPEGVADFYLFDEQQNEVSRRRVWIRSNDIQVNVIPNKNQYYQRSTASIDISLVDKSGKPMVGLLSVAVTDNNMVSPSSKLPSIVDYDFANKTGIGNISCMAGHNSGLSQDLADLILLTGNDQLQAKNNNAKQLDSVLSIRGKLLYKNTPLANESISLICSQNAGLFRTDTTDAAGNFQFSNLNFFDSTQFYIQLTNPKIDKQDLTLNLDSTVTLVTKTVSLSNDCLSEDQFNSGVQLFKKNNMDSFLIGNTRGWLQSITVKGKKTPEDKYGKRNKFSHVITREQLSKLEQSTTANAVKMVPGVMMVSGNLTIRGGTPTFDNAGILDKNIEPMVIVDGVQAVTGGGVVNYLNSIPPNIIDYIEVLTGGEAAQYGTRGANGVIIIKTGQPQYASYDLKNAITFYPKGYHISPEFYMPDYSNEKIKEAEFKDNRSTVYWNGSVWTDKNGKAKISFYTADAKTTYTVTVMGVTANGDLVMKEVLINRN